MKNQWKLMKHNAKTMKNNENWWKTLQKQWKLMKNKQKQWKIMKRFGSNLLIYHGDHVGCDKQIVNLLITGRFGFFEHCPLNTW